MLPPSKVREAYKVLDLEEVLYLLITNRVALISRCRGLP